MNTARIVALAPGSGAGVVAWLADGSDSRLAPSTPAATISGSFVPCNSRGDRIKAVHSGTADTTTIQT